MIGVNLHTTSEWGVRVTNSVDNPSRHHRRIGIPQIALPEATDRLKMRRLIRHRITDRQSWQAVPLMVVLRTMQCQNKEVM